MRPGHLLLISLIALLGLLLAGCGTPAAAPAPPTATPVPATATPVPAPTVAPTDTTPPQPPTDTTPPQPPTDTTPPQPPTATPIPAPTNTPTPIPTATPVPLDVVTHTVPFVDEGSGTAGLTVASAVHHHVATLLGSTLRLVDTTSGTVQGPITVTTDTLDTNNQGSTNVALLTDDAHARADVLIDGESVTTATLTTIDLDSARILQRRILRQLPLANIYAAVTVPPTGDLLVELEHVYSISNESPARLIRLSSDGSMRRMRLLGDVSTEGSLTLDAPAGRVLLSVTGIDTATVTAYDLRALTPTWSTSLPYKPAATVVDPARGRLWLLAPGGRATIVDVRSGQTVATCDPGYSKPAVWEGNNDLIVDPRTGLGYTSWTGGADYSSTHTAIDVIDPTRHTRTILTPDGGVLALATATTDRLIGLDAADNLVLRSTRDGHMLAVVAPGASFSDNINALSGSTVKYLTIAQAGPTIMIARAQNVPYQNTITGASTASGVVVLTLHDRP